MIHVTLAPEQFVEPASDALGRDRIGFSPTMSPAALYDAAHGAWVLGQNANAERFALFSCAGIVRLAVEIEAIDKVIRREPGDTRDDRSVIQGRILESGHPVYDKYVNKVSPVQNVRNPITYVRDPEVDGRPCLCGCGAVVDNKDFLPGHDQAALHDRVRQIGSVADFLAWFDVVRGSTRPIRELSAAQRA